MIAAPAATHIRRDRAAACTGEAGGMVFRALTSNRQWKLTAPGLPGLLVDRLCGATGEQYLGQRRCSAVGDAAARDSKAGCGDIGRSGRLARRR